MTDERRRLADYYIARLNAERERLEAAEQAFIAAWPWQRERRRAERTARRLAHMDLSDQAYGALGIGLLDPLWDELQRAEWGEHAYDPRA